MKLEEVTFETLRVEGSESRRSTEDLSSHSYVPFTIQLRVCFQTETLMDRIASICGVAVPAPHSLKAAIHARGQCTHVCLSLAGGVWFSKEDAGLIEFRLELPVTTSMAAHFPFLSSSLRKLTKSP